MSTPRLSPALVTVATLTFVAGSITAPAFAQSGTPDPTFGTGGVASFAIPKFVYGLTTQADGKVVVVGNTPAAEWGISRLNTDGSLDTSFGSGGSVILFGSSNDYAADIAIDSGGGILVTGRTTYPEDPGTFTVVRLLGDGSLDPAFADAGVAKIQIGKGSTSNCIVLQPDGKIVLGGYAYPKRGGFDFALARFHPDGSLDTDSFGPSGKKRITYKGYVMHDIDSRSTDWTHDGVIARQPDGKIVLGGYSGVYVQDSWTIARYETDGSVDKDFGNNGAVIQSFPGVQYVQLRGLATDGVRIHASGRGHLIASGDYDAMVAAYDMTGSLDTGFGSGGLALTGNPLYDSGTACALQADGKILVCGVADDGSLYDVAVFRFDVLGALDPTFDGDGMAIVPTGGTTGRSIVLDGTSIFVGGGMSPQLGAVVKYL